MRVAALVLGAGRGERLGHALPKAFVSVAGRPLLARSLESLAAVPELHWIVPVIPEGEQERYEALVAGLSCTEKLAPPVVGGLERQGSVQAGLRELPEDVEFVAVHDAARALVRPGDVSRVIEVACREGAAILAVPVSDTIKRVRAGRVVDTPPRSEFYAAQTPQVFRVELLREALVKAGAEGRRGTDCAQLVEALGRVVHVVEADPDNLKITRPADLEVASRILETVMGTGGPSVRIGQGLDAHQLVVGRPLRLGGVAIPYERGLEGHSDGDVLLHAIASALLGALGAGDLGTHFPSSDPGLEGIESGEILARVLAMVREKGFALGNLDATVVAQQPRLSGHLDAMRRSVAALLGAPEARVNVKVTSTDELGAIGRGEGMAAQAVVLLERA